MTAPRNRRARLALLTFAIFGSACDDVLVEQSNHQARKAYEHEAKSWLRWVMAQPHSTSSPVTDETGEHCAGGQDGNVWYLAGTFEGAVERECEIPPGRYLFFPLLNRWGLYLKEYYTDQQEFLDLAGEYFADQHANTCSLTLRLDGEDLAGTEVEDIDDALYVDVMTPFRVDLDDDNPHGIDGGRMPAVTDGQFALLRPLDPGVHTLEFGGEVCADGVVVFETFATYTLHVHEAP